MDFYHVLPSNVSPDYFPKNSASQYSTPLRVPYSLTGEWEVALMNLTYSSCINTFNNDKIAVEEECSVSECVPRIKQPYKVMLSVPPSWKSGLQAREEWTNYINNNFKNLLEVRMSDDVRFATWKILNTDFYYILSPAVQNLFQLWSDVLTDQDNYHTNVAAFFKGYTLVDQKDAWITIVPKAPSSYEEYRTLVIKKKKKKITANKLFQRFQKVIPKDVMEVTLNKKGQFSISKFYNDNKMILLNSPLRHALTYTNAALFAPGILQYYGHDLSKFDDEWTCSILTLKQSVTHQGNSTKIITLPPCSFEDEKEAVRFLNSKILDPRITFTYSSNKMMLKIGKGKLTVVLDDALRDIFAFDTNTFSGSDSSHTASGSFSLTRCIQYLYVYSNIGDSVRVGNTESPLLEIVPFSTDKKCNLLTEKVFKTPMYIRVKQNRISQIDVAIYDGAGELVPFVADAITSLCLHFRQV